MRNTHAVTAGPSWSVADRRARALATALLACALVALAPAAAHAASIIAVTPSLPTNVSVGDTNVDATLTITNANSGADISSTVCEPGDPAPCTGAPGITLVPSCSSLDFSLTCLPSGANPGVFSIHSAVGAASTACSAKTFAVTTVDPTFGKVRFAPSGGNVTLPNPGSACRIDFKINVLALPADAQGTTGYQTLQTAEAAAYSNLGTGTFSRNTQPAVNVTLAPPTLTDTDPDSPANDNAPEIKGSAPAAATQVRLYTNASCTGTPIAQGSPGTFASPGLTAPVNDDTTTTLYAVSVDNLSGISDCSTSSITYQEDSTAPGTPSSLDLVPDSPANNNAPRLKGNAAAGSTVRLYTTASCTGTIAAQGSAGTFDDPGLLLSVANDTTTTYYASATDAAGNVSGCSAAITYIEDSTPPAAPVLSGSAPTSPGNDNTPQIIGSAPADTTVTLYATAACTGVVAGTGSAAAFASSGITVSVSDNTTTIFYATSTDAAGNVSPCSAGTVYVEDSIPPSGAVMTGSSPASPANQNAPRITGTAPAGTTVRLYTNAACSGEPAFVGSATTFASPGIAVSVADNSSTTFYAQAVDAADNPSACSSTGVPYVEDSTGPQTSIDGGPPDTGASATPTFTFSSTEPGTTFECRLDSGEFVPCTSPYTTPTLANGAHTFEVRSRDAAGNVDATSEVRTFTVGSPVTPPAPPPPPPLPGVTPPPGIKRAQPGCAGVAGTVFVGTKSNNVRTGGKANDIMFGLSGNDTLRGGAGLDCLYGEEGNDKLSGGSGADRLFGGSGKDRLDGQAANDTLSGSFGNDRLNGGSGNDRLTAGGGNDTLIDRRGIERFSGGSGKDVIDARDATLAGRRQRDRILCGPGKDRVRADPRDIVSKDCEKSGVIRRSLRTISAR